MSGELVERLRDYADNWSPVDDDASDDARTLFAQAADALQSALARAEKAEGALASFKHVDACDFAYIGNVLDAAKRHSEDHENRFWREALGTLQRALAALSPELEDSLSRSQPSGLEPAAHSSGLDAEPSAALLHVHEALTTVCDWFAQREMGEPTRCPEATLFARCSQAADYLDAALGLTPNPSAGGGKL